MGAEADAGPIGGLLRVRERLAIVHERRQELVHEVWMRAAVACALGEAQMRFLRNIINAPGRETADRSGEEFSVIWNLDSLRDLRLGQFRRVQDMRLVLDQGPFERFF